MADPYDLEQLVTVSSDVYPTVLSEIRRGAKRPHRTWFILLQIAKLQLQSDSGPSLPAGRCVDVKEKWHDDRTGT